MYRGANDNDFKRPRLGNRPNFYPRRPLLPLPNWGFEWRPIRFPLPPPYTAGHPGYHPYPPPHFFNNEYRQQWGSRNLSYYPPSQASNEMIRMQQGQGDGQRSHVPNPNFAEDDDFDDLTRKERPPPPPPPPSNPPEINEAYSSFFKDIALSERSLDQVSDNDLNEMARHALEVVSGYKDTVTMFAFLNKLLLNEESFPVNQITKHVTTLRVFVRLIRVLNLGEQPPEEVKKMSNVFAGVFNRTLTQIKTLPYSEAVGHLKILESLKSEFIQIEFLSMQLDHVEVVECMEINGNGAENDNLQETRKLSSQCDIVSTSFSAPIMDIGAQSRIPALEGQIVTTTITTTVEGNEVVSASEPEKSTTSMENSNSEFVTQEENFQLSFKLQILKVFNKLIIRVGDCALEENEPQNLVDSLVQIFINSRNSDPLHNDKMYLGLVLKTTKYLNNDARKINLWILADIAANLASPQNFSQDEAEKLRQLIGDMDIHQCHRKWDTIELMELKRRLGKHIDARNLTPIDSFVTRLTVEKYRIDNNIPVKLNLSDFYPRNLSVLKRVSKKVLRKILPVEDFVNSCKKLQTSLHSMVNTTRAPSPDIVCLGTPFRPPPEVVTLSDIEDE